ncbi:hypothetical protein [Cryobacterium psychrophilum]|uniref:Uncharacterized protein n=1 Tax=Cryobacterium psychrophilum TaxID=41988 RepID=A0A4Y8KNY4_9MICO|nr:hypothetical protein [Cryobacterium psychrophilum]TDW31406.1 hypothetical protein EDD25_3219 [Cryobacterium psychrophilum]TFD78848.1 hypothetical protein E3T53_08655 [Cryobacterium psychrophilum]
MSTIEEEIAAVKHAAQKKLSRLRERERKVQLALDLRVVALLREKNPNAYETVRVEARAQLNAEAARRAERARRLPRSPTDAQQAELIGSDDARVRITEHGVVGAQ